MNNASHFPPAAACPEDRIRIESFGVHIPEKVLTMEELLASCRRRPRWDLERITGIHERRVAVNEYAVDLGIQAARQALDMSCYRAEDLDVVICTSISKYNRKNEFHLEPASAVRIRAAIGAGHARVFDVVNACAGMFTGIYILQGMIRCGMAERGMVVSGEQNMPIAETAARELRHSFDGQLAALTLGDGGAALVLDRSPDPHLGFQYIGLVTGAKHDHYCYSRPSRHGPGGILVTKARGLQRKGNEHFPAYFKRALDASGWSLDDLQHIIPHQVSVRAIENGVRAVGNYLGATVPDITRCSADHYGNTSTTSHFLAIHDAILQGRIQNGHNAMLVSGASGIVIAHATYTFDDLPQRYRARFSGVS
ncbi:MAG: 3-oxoacyl-ACP synthase [Candidatus Aminicenantes bacterium]|nr:3-oxoacyl-ACP synthase [Candidatus Aminicenantes bacterium]